MKKLTLLLLTLALLGFAGHAQSLRDINLRLSHDNKSIRYIDLFAGNIVFSISPKGSVRLSTLESADQSYEQGFANRGKLKSLGDLPVDYYDNFSKYSAGKVKSVGKIEITYIDQFDGFDNLGRVKTIGNLKFAYRDRFDGFDNGGKIKLIGDTRITYYDRFDGDDLNGRVKSIGNTVIKYYDRFDGAEKAGKIKSITGSTPHISISDINLEDDEV